MVHAVKVFGIGNKAEVDVFLEFSCFFSDPMDVGNLISVSSAFLKYCLNIWNFMVHILLNPGLENYEHCKTYVLVLDGLCGDRGQLWLTVGTRTVVVTSALALLEATVFSSRPAPPPPATT